MRAILIPAAALTALLAACGGGGGYTNVEIQIRTGQLDRAEAALVGDASPRADELRATIAARREAQAALEQELAALEALEPMKAMDRLRELARRERDPAAQEQIAAALSRAADRRAEGASARGHEVAEFVPRRPEEDAPPAARRDPARDAALVDGILVRVRAQLAKAQWSRASGELGMALDHAGARLGELRALAETAREDAQREADGMVIAAQSATDEAQLIAERNRIDAELARFPSGAGLETLREALADLDGRLELRRVAREGLRRAPVAAPRVDGAALAAELEQGLESARQVEGAGDLEAAMDAWLEAAFDHPPGAQRDAAVARARELERRLALRTELVDAIAREPERFAQLGLGAADAVGPTVDGRAVSWDDVELALLVRAGRSAKLSREASLGLLFERAARDDAEGALAEAGRLFEKGRLEQGEAYALVASVRGEEPPEGGYRFEDGRWVGAAAAELAEAQGVLARLERDLARAKPAKRDALLDELVAMGALAEPAAERALAARWATTIKALTRSKTLSQLERLSAQRVDLDRRREDALALIFDEAEYFYPYRPPEVPSEKARLYWPVQQRVDELVGRVRELWGEGREVKLAASFRAALDELAWTDDAAAAFDLDFELPADLPTWVLALDPRSAQVTLADFAWDAEERERLAYDRAVRARNERLWKAADDLPDEQRPGAGEMLQVRITNDYRTMLGRRALAWNPLLQAAAQMHSDYMADTGDFGHYEPTPERRTPGDRMRLVGYAYGISENCHMGGGDPEGAHNGWTHSSGHHRNLLNPGHREMASAVASRYYTQNFGVDKGFADELEAWQD